MFFSSGKTLAAATLLGALPIQAAPYPFFLEKRTCNADNLLRLLRTPSNLPEALPFCSTYLGLPASTITVSTVTPTVTSYTTKVAIETALFTELPIVSSTLTATETSVIVQTTTITVEPQQTITAIDRREIGRRCSSSTTTTRASTTSRVTTTKYTTPLAEKVTGATYPPSRISSACSCLTIPIEISSVTATAPGVTEVITVPSTSSTSETVTITLTELVSTTETTTIFSTVTETSTRLSEPTAYALKVVAPGTSDDGKFVLNRNENPDSNGPNTSQVFPLTTDPSQATKYLFRSDGLLQIITSSTQYSSAVVGQESAQWVLFLNPTTLFGPLYSNRYLSVVRCSGCLVVKWQKDPITGFVTPLNIVRSISICDYQIVGYDRGVHLGISSSSSFACIPASLQLVPLY
ncbi:hypothetical protein TWF730_005255 [Orbilia blumenaviensis]|uniref:Uncharacterized protein n=1 Tax=Orbilia blumenaviensis TaxID=1796055 RepID=A0AAV9VNZ3_9PEZI